MNLRLFALVSLAGLSLISLAHSQTTDAKNTQARQTAALAVADHWLQLIDTNDVKQSWKETAEPFQQAVNQIKWADLMITVRTPLGKVVSRSFKSADYKTQLPGVPDGEYFLIQYNTTFEYKKSAVETVTIMLDKDGKGRVAGYFIE